MEGNSGVIMENEMGTKASEREQAAATSRNKNPLRHASTFFSLLKETFQGWSEHRGLRLGAALAFYTIFAIAPLFVIVLAIAGFAFGEEAARRELFAQLSGLVGERGGEAIEAIVASAIECAELLVNGAHDRITLVRVNLIAEDYECLVNLAHSPW